jgi:hypothetical protein
VVVGLGELDVEQGFVDEVAVYGGEGSRAEVFC